MYHVIDHLISSPDTDINLLWFSKVLEPVAVADSASESIKANHSVCTALDLLAFLVQELPRNVILNGFTILHKGVGACMSCGNTKVVRYVHGLLTRLVTMYPTKLGKWCREIDHVTMQYSFHTIPVSCAQLCD